MPKPLMLLLSLLFLAPGCGNRESNKPSAKQPPAPVVTVSGITRMDVPIYREFVGRADANRTVNVHPQISGILLEALFAEGQPVQLGELLFRIDPSQYQAALRSAEAQLAKSEADVEQAKAQLGKTRQDVARYEPLASQRAIPQEDLENARAAEKIAEAQVQQAISNVKAAQAAVAQAELNLGYTEIRSPIAGIIGRREVDPGNLVNPQTRLVIVSNADPIRVNYDISEVDYMRFAEQAQTRRAGRRYLPEITYELLLPDGRSYPHRGSLYMVGRAVTAQTGTIPITAEFPNPDNLLRPGQFVRVRVTAGEIPNAVLVPQSAVQQLLGTTSVLIVGPDNRVVQRTVTTGGTYEDFTVITSGLDGTERVVVEGQHKVRPGMPVTPQAANGR